MCVFFCLFSSRSNIWKLIEMKIYFKILLNHYEERNVVARYIGVRSDLKKSFMHIVGRAPTKANQVPVILLFHSSMYLLAIHIEHLDLIFEYQVV